MTNSIHAAYEIDNDNPAGKVDQYTLLALDEALMDGWKYNNDEMDEKWLTVSKGQITFDAEGNDDESSPYFSRKIHWPGRKSGATIGRGYDLGSRSKDEVYNDLTGSGVPNDIAELISNGAQKKGNDARDFVNSNIDNIDVISREQQYNLFLKIYPIYEERTVKNYEKWTKVLDRTEWSDLNPVIKDILIDFVYQGFTKGPRPMVKGMNNDKKELIEYINKEPIMRDYEKGRNRVKYLGG